MKGHRPSVNDKVAPIQNSILVRIAEKSTNMLILFTAPTGAGLIVYQPIRPYQFGHAPGLSDAPSRLMGGIAIEYL